MVVIQFRDVLDIPGREVTWRKGSFPPLVAFGLIWPLTPGFWFLEGALDFQMSYISHSP